MTEYDLAGLGWNEEFQAAFALHETDGLVPGRVAVQHRGGYRLYTELGEVPAELAGRYRHEAGWRTGLLPAVGDWVAARPHDSGAVIVDVLPRRTHFSRKAALSVAEQQVIAANVDTVFLVGALGREFRAGFLRRLERYLTLGWESGARPVVILTKTDLCEDVTEIVADVESVAFGVPVHAVSNLSGDGVDELAQYLGYGETVALLGSSGVGKSTLINRLCGREVLATQDVRDDGIGRHTTTHRELVLLPAGGLLLDTPGMRELQLWDGAEGMSEAFGDVDSIAAECRFADCAHLAEPGCAVQAAVAEGTLAEDRFDSWRKLQSELARLERRQNQRLRAEVTKEYRRRTRAMRTDKY